ncbi:MULTISPECIES: hypothetical protein [Bacillus cereus group]|uniref:hypothetical protein n=1 Tax=Bacillus TaxID=1386 RepID=UPI0002E353CE|nr:MULTISPECIES: hypothetical protein [Bacillus cereus group]MEB9630862.1 hypothetical protein [Bacillus anthracis]
MSNRNIADLFGDSAVRTTEEAEKEEQHKNNDNETLPEHKVNVNVNKTLENEGETNLPEEPKETPTGKNVPDLPAGTTPGNPDPGTPKDPTPIVKQDDILDFLKVEQEKKVVGFHLDKDVRQAFQKVLGKKPQRGAQSELANRIFRDFFEKRGLL